MLFEWRVSYRSILWTKKRKRDREKKEEREGEGEEEEEEKLLYKVGEVGVSLTENLSGSWHSSSAWWRENEFNRICNHTAHGNVLTDSKAYQWLLRRAFSAENNASRQTRTRECSALNGTASRRNRDKRDTTGLANLGITDQVILVNESPTRDDSLLYYCSLGDVLDRSKQIGERSQRLLLWLSSKMGVSYQISPDFFEVILAAIITIENAWYRRIQESFFSPSVEKYSKKNETFSEIDPISIEDILGYILDTIREGVEKRIKRPFGLACGTRVNTQLMNVTQMNTSTTEYFLNATGTWLLALMIVSAYRKRRFPWTMRDQLNDGSIHQVIRKSSNTRILRLSSHATVHLTCEQLAKIME